MMRKHPSHTVRSIPSHVGTRQAVRPTAGPRSSSASMKTFIYTSPALISDSHEGTEFVTQTPWTGRFIGHFIASLWFLITLFHFQFLMFFTKQGKTISWDHMFTMWPVKGPSLFKVAALMFSTVSEIGLRKCMFKKDKSSADSNALLHLFLSLLSLLTQSPLLLMFFEPLGLPSGRSHGL